MPSVPASSRREVRLRRNNMSVQLLGDVLRRECLPRLQILFHHLTVEEDEKSARGTLLRHEASEANASGVVVVHLQVFPNHSARVVRRVHNSSARRRRRSRKGSLARSLLLDWHSNSMSVVAVSLLRHVGHIFIHAAIFKRTHHQRVPLGASVLLDQERGPERLAEESLTLLRDVVRGVSAARLLSQLLQLRGRAVVLRSHARRRRWG